MREPHETTRLRLRDITESDAQLMFELDADPEVMRHIGVAAPPDLQSHRERIRSVYVPAQSHPWHGIWMVEDLSSSEFLGWVFARPADQAMFAKELGWTRSDEVEVGFRLHRAAWGQGIATEAAAVLLDLAMADETTSAVVGCASAENLASIRVLEKLGLKQVGQVLLAGEDVPTVRLQRSKPEEERK